MGFTLWFTNYVSNKSINLMAMEYPRIGPHLDFGKTDKKLAESIAELYKRNNCWTWFDDYEWHDDETFIRDIDTVDEKGRCGDVLPINLIDVGVEQPPVQKSSFRKFIFRIRETISTLLLKNC